MNFKLILALVDQTKVDPILKAAREAGATGATVITSARGEGLVPKKTFLGLDLAPSAMSCCWWSRSICAPDPRERGQCRPFGY